MCGTVVESALRRVFPVRPTRKSRRIPPGVSLPESDGPSRVMADMIFRDFGSTPASIFVVLRGRIARAARLSEQRAEPSFSLAGAVLPRVRRLCRKAENRPRSTKNRSGDAWQPSRVNKTRFARSRTRLGIDFGRRSALPDAPASTFLRSGASVESLRAFKGRARDVPRHSRDVPESLPQRFWSPQGVPTGSRDRF